MSVAIDPPFTEEGLLQVEDLYRTNYAHLVNANEFEYQMGLFLGEVMFRSGLGNWTYYQGKYQVMDPIVIGLEGKQLFVQPLLFCRDLHQKRVIGSHSRRSLLEFVRQAEKNAQP